MDLSYFDFLATHPSLFFESTGPLEVDNRLCTTESKFGLLHCMEYQKTLYVVQQLRGSTRVWWATYTATLQDNHQVLWGEFRTVFCGHHIPAGLMHHKQQEFLELQQGPHSVYECIKKFNYLAQYGARHVDTDEKKIEFFWKGLTTQLHDHLVLFHDLTYNALVCAAIDQDGTI
jgi:hypothetical protein